jgi:hypothetical protein
MQTFTSTELELIAFVLPLLDKRNRVSATTLAHAHLLDHPDLGAVSMPRDYGATFAFDPDELREACEAIDAQYMGLTHSFP